MVIQKKIVSYDKGDKYGKRIEKLNAINNGQMSQYV